MESKLNKDIFIDFKNEVINYLQKIDIENTTDNIEIVIDEAIEKNCNLIVSFHPIIFNGLKKITGSSYVERVVLKAIENKIAIYAIHTALDNAFVGTNAGLCEILGLQNKKVLIPQVSTIKQLGSFANSRKR